MVHSVHKFIIAIHIIVQNVEAMNVSTVLSVDFILKRVTSLLLLKIHVMKLQNG